MHNNYTYSTTDALLLLDYDIDTVHRADMDSEDMRKVLQLQRKQELLACIDPDDNAFAFGQSNLD